MAKSGNTSDLGPNPHSSGCWLDCRGLSEMRIKPELTAARTGDRGNSGVTEFGCDAVVRGVTDKRFGKENR